MQAPSKIIKLGNSPQGGKLKADFTNPLPAFVKVKNTNDENQVTPSGNWISTNKYASLAVTLQLLSVSKAVVLEANYDVNGNIVPNIGSSFATLPPTDGMSFEKLSPTSVVISIFFESENNIQKYSLIKRTSESSYLISNPIGFFNFESSKGGAYIGVITDNNVPQERVFYKVVGYGLDNTEIIDIYDFILDNGIV